MRFISNLSLISFLSSSALAAAPAQFSTKYPMENIRFMTKDGQNTYLQRGSDLELVNQFRSSNVMKGTSSTQYLVTGSQARHKVVIETDPTGPQDLDLNKLHSIHVASLLGGSAPLFVGSGRAPRLHLDDEWVTWWDPKDKVIHVQFLRSKDRHYIIRLGRKHNPYFTPDVIMLDPETVIYTDINEKGVPGLLTYSLTGKQTTLVRKGEQPGSHFELCTYGKYAALGEFSYDDVNHGSSISILAWKTAPSPDGFTSVYRSSDNDSGQMVCAADKVWFVKTVAEDRQYNIRSSAAANLNLATGKIQVVPELEKVSNIINMDGRILAPVRGEIYVLEGAAGSDQDVLKRPGKPTPTRKP